MTIRITFEFATVMDAINHLRLHGADTLETYRGENPMPDVPQEARAAVDPMPELKSDTPDDLDRDAPPKKGRKPRADKGEKRGPNKRTAGAADFTTQDAKPEGASAPAAAEPAASEPNAAASAAAPQAAPSGAASEPTLDDVKAALQKVYDTQPDDAAGMQLCRDVLSRQGVQKIRDLKPEQYAALIQIAAEVAAGQPV